MRRVKTAVVGAVLGACLIGGSAVALTPRQVARQYARCLAATERVSAINSWRNTIDPNASPIEFAIASSQLQKALQYQARVC